MMASTPISVAQARNNAILAEYTTFRIGGPCRQLIECGCAAAVEEAAAYLAARKVPFMLIGGGSNLLVSDDGVAVAVLRFVSRDLQLEVHGETLWVEGGCEVDAVAAWAAENGWAGLEFLTGIPGTVGGAVAGNAGAFGRQIGDTLVSARVMSRDGRVGEVAAADLGFAYRRSRLQKTGEMVLGVKLRVMRGDRARLRDERARILTMRLERHPDWRAVPTAGSFFKNIEPTSAAQRRQAAGWFLEQVGAKNMRVGRAYVFEKHANIIVAEPGASASEVLTLAHQMAQAVWRTFQVKLEPEVRLVGDFPPELQFQH